MRRRSLPKGDLDGPWKEALERYFPEFVQFFSPHIHAEVDWSRGHRFLDKELQRVTPKGAGRRAVDKLVEVSRGEGETAWVLVHVEVQSQVDADFPRRMYVYNYRLFDRFHREAASLGVLGDLQADWRPSHFGYDLWGCRPGIEFPVVKLVDYDEEALKASPNPFAVFVLAHLNTVRTRGRPERRLAAKIAAVEELYRRGYSRDDVVALFRFVEWLMRLPKELEQPFEDAVEKLEVQEMPYVSSIERRALKRGRREDICMILAERFGDPAATVSSQVSAIEDEALLTRLVLRAATAPDLEAFAAELPPDSRH